MSYFPHANFTRSWTLKYHEENFGSIQAPDNILVFSPQLFTIKYGKHYFSLEKSGRVDVIIDHLGYSIAAVGYLILNNIAFRWAGQGVMNP